MQNSGSYVTHGGVQPPVIVVTQPQCLDDCVDDTTGIEIEFQVVAKRLTNEDVLTDGLSFKSVCKFEYAITRKSTLAYGFIGGAASAINAAGGDANENGVGDDLEQAGKFLPAFKGTFWTSDQVPLLPLKSQLEHTDGLSGPMGLIRGGTQTPATEEYWWAASN